MSSRHLFPEAPLHAPRHRRVARWLALAVALVILAGSAPWAGTERKITKPADLDADLLKAILVIRQSFSNHQPERLLPLVPEASKVYVAVKALASEAGFYSRDQLQNLLQQAFASHRTVGFMVRLDRIRGADEGSGVILCPAAWTYENHGEKEKARLRFVLTRISAQWTLKEIRETH